MTKKIFAFGILFLISFNLFSGDRSPQRPSFEIYAAGNINQCPVYQLILENEKNNEYQIVLKDKTGTVLHEEYVSGKHVIRNYMIDIYDLGNMDVIIEINNRYGMHLQSMHIPRK
jgi:hypothetical protein